MAKDDFVNVTLTDFGREFSGGDTVQVHAGNHSFYFKPGEVQRVTRAFDWNRVLKNEHVNGHPLFCIVSDVEEAEVERLQGLGIPAVAGEHSPEVPLSKVEEAN